jgi:hypothetical protein
VGSIEGDYVRDSTSKGRRRFVFDHSAVDVSTVFVAKDVETSESTH